MIGLKEMKYYNVDFKKNLSVFVPWIKVFLHFKMLESAYLKPIVLRFAETHKFPEKQRQRNQYRHNSKMSWHK